MPRFTKAPSAKDLRKAARESWIRARKAEREYQKQIASVGKQVGALVKGYVTNGRVTNLSGLLKALEKYSEIIKPWARAVTIKMHADVARRDAHSWVELSREMGKTLRKEILEAPAGRVMRRELDLQAELITSLPLDAAKRVHKLAIEALTETGARADELAKEILASGHVTAGRAKLIARTETARTASLLVEARAQYLGSTHYRWETSRDADVRPLHRKLQGKVFRWDDPPVSGESGEKSNPGQIYNCRCFAYPILPE